jgi:hypothetical protein
VHSVVRDVCKYYGPVSLYLVFVLTSSLCDHPLKTLCTDLESVTVTTCKCQPVAILLVRNGVFPASPTKPQTGISIDLLEVYRALLERSCDAITALAAALHTIYDRREFKIYSTRVSTTMSSLSLSVNSFPRIEASVRPIHFGSASATPSSGQATSGLGCRRGSRLPSQPRMRRCSLPPHPPQGLQGTAGISRCRRPQR